MAIFNPQINPTQDPEWLRLSRPIETPEANKSTGTLLTGIGETLGEGVKAADFITKSTIEDNIHAAVDKERDSYTAALKLADGSVRASSAPTSLTDTGEGGSTAPSWASTLSSSVGTLGSARASGKISETAYYGRLDTLAKDFRSRYPGYRDYVDQEIQKTTGVDPANAQIKSMIGDINSLAAQSAAQANKFDNFAQSKLGIPGVYEAWQASKAGTGTQQELYRRVASWETTESKFKMNHLTIEDFKGDREKQGIFATKATTQLYSDLANESLANFTIQTPRGPMTMGEYAAALSDPSSGIPQPTPQQAQQIAQSLAAKTTELHQHMLALSRQIPQSGGDSYETLIGADKNNKLVTDALANHDLYQKLFLDGNYGLVAQMANLGKARATEMNERLETGPHGEYVQIFRGLVQAGGKDFADAMTKTSLLSNLSGPDKNAKIIGQPNLLVPSGFTGVGASYIDPSKVFTLDKAMKAAEYAVEPGKTRAAVLAVPALVSEPTATDQVKTNITLSTYIGNTFSKVINSIPMDYFNKNGKEVPGKYAAFNNIVSPQNVEATWQLGQKDKALWDTYRNGVEEAFANQLAIPSLKELSSIQTNPKVGIAYDDKNLEFKFVVNGRMVRSKYDKGGEDGFFSQLERDNAVTMLNRFNSGIKSMASIYSKESVDTNARIYSLLQGLSQLQGTPVKMLDAMNATIKPTKETK